MRMKYYVAIIFLFFSSLSFALEFNQAEAAKLYANDIFEAYGFEKEIKIAIEDETNKAVSDMITAHPEDKDKENELYKITKSYMEKQLSKENWISIIAKIVQELFTAQELNELVAFNRTPLGQKTLKNLQIISARTSLDIVTQIEGDKKAQKELEEKFIKVFEKKSSK